MDVDAQGILGKHRWPKFRFWTDLRPFSTVPDHSGHNESHFMRPNECSAVTDNLDTINGCCGSYNAMSIELSQDLIAPIPQMHAQTHGGLSTRGTSAVVLHVTRPLWSLFDGQDRANEYI